jgi:ABC-type transport system involved in multi-copper enzyme maturation permease subunit
VLNNGCAIIITIDLVLLAHLVYRATILVVKFVCILIKNVNALGISNIIELFFVRRRNFYPIDLLIVEVIASNGENRE